MTVLWVVAFLTLAVFTATQLLFTELEIGGNAESFFQAEVLADRGIALAAHPGTERDDPVLSQTIDEISSFAARIESEGRRLNLNFFLDPTRRIVLEELFHQWGLRRDEAVDVVDNLIDWIDSDDRPTNRGAEKSHYRALDRFDHPFNRPFRSLEEVPLVAEFERVENARPDWRDRFTLLSSGPLDVNEADPELIAATCQCALESARLFARTRDGRDGVNGTEDDVRVESVEEALDLLQVPSEYRESISGRVTTEDPVKRLVSVGRHDAISVERAVTVHYNGGLGAILRWSTRRLP